MKRSYFHHPWLVALMAVIATTTILTLVPTTQGFSPSINRSVNLFPFSSSSTQLFYTDNNDNGGNNNSNNNNGNNNNSGNNGSSNNNDKVTTTANNNVRRTSIQGISVSPIGFLMLLQTSNYHNSKSNSNVNSKTILPIRLTSNLQDTYATTSAESLTICQLLSGVDMAGAIFNPEIMNHLVGLYCSSSSEYDEEDDEDEEDENEILNFENDDGDDDESSLMNFIEDELGLESQEFDYEEEYYEESTNEGSNKKQQSLQVQVQPMSTFNVAEQEQQQQLHQETKEYVHEYILSSFERMNNIDTTTSFEDANSYQRNRVKFPKITLDSIHIDLPFVAATAPVTTTTTGGDSKENNNDNIHETIELWNDYITTHINNKNNNDDDDSDFLEEGVLGQCQILPLPLQFTLQCRIDNHYKLTIPLFSELTSLSSYLHHHQTQQQQHQSSSSTSSSSKSTQELLNLMEESRNIIQQILYNYDDHTSGSFVSLGLALRYECPLVISERLLIVLEELQQKQQQQRSTSSTDDSNPITLCIQQSSNDDNVNNNNNNDENGEIQKVLPQWRSTKTLQSQSQRVVSNIEHGFQITKLQGALKIAKDRGDDLAVMKIQAEIHKLMNDGSNSSNDI